MLFSNLKDTYTTASSKTTTSTWDSLIEMIYTVVNL